MGKLGKQYVGGEMIGPHTYYSGVHADDDYTRTLVDEILRIVHLEEYSWSSMRKYTHTGDTLTYVIEAINGDDVDELLIPIVNETSCGLMSAADKVDLVRAVHNISLLKEGVYRIRVNWLQNSVNFNISDYSDELIDEYVIGCATQAKCGLMSAADKTKLEDLAKKVDDIWRELFPDIKPPKREDSEYDGY